MHIVPLVGLLLSMPQAVQASELDTYHGIPGQPTLLDFERLACVLGTGLSERGRAWLCGQANADIVMCRDQRAKGWDPVPKPNETVMFGLPVQLDPICWTPDEFAKNRTAEAERLKSQRFGDAPAASALYTITLYRNNMARIIANGDHDASGKPLPIEEWKTFPSYDPSKKLATNQVVDVGSIDPWFPWIISLAEGEAGSLVCPSIPEVRSGETRACSKRTIVKALGDPGTPHPDCPYDTYAESQAAGLKILSSVFEASLTTGNIYAALASAVLQEIFRTRITEELNLNKLAGCRLLCAVIPGGKEITRVQGYFAVEPGTPLQPITENGWGDDNAIGWVRVDPDANGIKSDSKNTVVCRNFRSWKEHLQRPAQLVVDYR